MAEKDRSERRKEEVAYFIPKYAQKYACLGSVGHPFNFSKETPAKCTLPSDIALFRSKVDLVETDANGVPLSERAHIVADSGTVPPTSPLEASDDEGSVVLKTDKPKRKKRAEVLEPDNEEEEDEEEEEEEEKPKKKKPKKKKKSEKSSGKKKKKKKKSGAKKKKKKTRDEDEDEDWEDED